jgi:transposase-like protein
MSNPYKLRFASIRRWPVGEKCRIVEQTLKPGASVARVAKAHGVNANQVFIGAVIETRFRYLTNFKG